MASRLHASLGVKRFAILAIHALAGWAYCGSLMALGPQFLSMEATLVLHAIGAPVGFSLIAWLYFRRFGFTSPLETALAFLGIVLALDVLVVALLIERSFEMFRSFLGTWLPLSLSFAATYAVGLLFEKRPGRPAAAPTG